MHHRAGALVTVQRVLAMPYTVVTGVAVGTSPRAGAALAIGLVAYWYDVAFATVDELVVRDDGRVVVRTLARKRTMTTADVTGVRRRITGPGWVIRFRGGPVAVLGRMRELDGLGAANVPSRRSVRTGRRRSTPRPGRLRRTART